MNPQRMIRHLKAHPNPDKKMDYFSILNLNKEPFSNSPDPDYFFNSQQHVSCLQKLELSLRLRRGLNVVIGEVGTGKTTLCRQLLRRFSDDIEIEPHLILDPHFSTPHEFLLAVTEMLTNKKYPEEVDDYRLKEHIKQALFTKGVDENKTIILIIDEGQKIPVFCLELLREFLNFETNDYKLLQIAIFAQREFDNTLKEHANFADRINLYHLLKPMNFRDTCSMIQYRLNQSSSAAKRLALFTYPALWAIYRATNGYPRKIVNLCHRSILTMIIQNKSKANWFLVQSCIRRVFSLGKKRSWQFSAILLIVLVGGAVFIIPKWLPNQTTTPVAKETEASKGIHTATIIPIPVPPVTSNGSESIVTAKDNIIPETKTPPTIDKISLSGDTPDSPDHARLQSSAAAPQEATSPGVHAIPGVLGQMKVIRHETLGGLIQTIYGVFNKSHLQSVLRINPHITDPDTINVGDVILFPAIASHVEQQPLKRWWVQITEEDNLETIFRFLRQDTAVALPARLIPHWNRSSGLHFSVFLGQPFYDEASAVNKLKLLRLSGGAKGRIVSEWDTHTIFYANPYQTLTRNMDKQVR
jgi:general secretion pathway protein A